MTIVCEICGVEYESGALNYSNHCSQYHTVEYTGVLTIETLNEWLKAIYNEKNNKEGSDGRTDQEELPKQI